MTLQMDCFVDEVKDGGTVTGLGVLLMEAGVTEGLDRQLEHPIAQRVGRPNVTIGEIHWSALGNIEATIAKEWLTSFMQGPLMFFVHVVSLPGEEKADTLQRLIVQLEGDPHLPGFSRANTTVHFDTDTADPSTMLRDLRRDFGLLRAFKWNSKGSRLIQLCDVLLGLTSCVSRTPAPLAPGQSPSRRALRRGSVIAAARAEAQRFADRNKINAILIFDHTGLHHALGEQAATPGTR